MVASVALGFTRATAEWMRDMVPAQSGASKARPARLRSRERTYTKSAGRNTAKM
jgi:hypothetical protein